MLATMTAIPSPWQAYAERIQSANTSAELQAIDHELFGRKAGILTVALKEIGTLDPETRRSKAQELNVAKKELTDSIEARMRTLATPSADQLKAQDGIDISMELPTKEHGHLHLIPEFIRNVEDVFGRMGFTVVPGPEVECEDINFNMLNIPATHPARDMQATFWLAGSSKEHDPKKRMLLRTHTSNVQFRFASTHTPPFRIIYHGKTYRKDDDATHSPMFHQFEAMVIGKGITLANMKSVMINAIRELTSSTAEFRFRTGYFPFVEPGLEVDMRWQGDDAESREGKWLEIAGCGMVHPNVLKHCKIDPEEWQGFAFGFGVERMIMIKHKIPDLRSFYQGDLRFLRQF